MRWILPLTFYFLLVLPYSAHSQEYSYTHYDIPDGLAGSTVYCITQDKDGFLWMGTESGVSRFDGTHFRNFTTRDGLPDLEVLEMFADSHNRIWMAPFRKAVCYYYKGRFHTKENDSLLHALHFRGNVERFAEDRAGDILIQESNRLHVLYKDGRLLEIDSIHGRPIQHCHAVSRSRDGNFLVQESDSIYTLRDGRFTASYFIYLHEPNTISNFIYLSPDMVVWRTHRDEAGILSLVTGAIRIIPFHYFHYSQVNYSIVNDTVVYSNESTGTTEYTLNGGPGHRFLEGAEVSRAFVDDEGNTWFTTIGRGIYRLNSAELRSINDLHQASYDACAVTSIKKVGNTLLLGSNRNSIFRLHLPDMAIQGQYMLSSEEKKRVLFIDSVSRGRLFYGTDNCLQMTGPRSQDNIARPCNVKAAMLKPDGKILVGSGNGFYLVDPDHFMDADTLLRERTTTVFCTHDSIYIGTLNGLYLMTADGRMQWLGKDIPFLRQRIAAMTGSGDGVLWISSYDDAGIIGLKNGRIWRTIGSQQGLTSDICRTLTLQNDYLWVGTDKGLNKVSLSLPDSPVMQYTSFDGLGSNVINAVFVDSPMVYVGTPAGLSYFNERRINPHSSCRLSWLDILGSGRSLLGDTAGIRLPYNQNNIHFEYAGISYTSAGRMTYQYRLLGLDTAWKFTHETFLDYPTLPSGKYQLEIIAINKFNVRSKPKILPFEVATPFWRTGWFATVAALFLISATWFLVTLRIRHIRKRQEEEEALARRMRETEHMALQAQMNPHFIFNCLNSIQQYIFDQDIFAANKYITGFSKLIRATLHNSSQSFITLADEVSYLFTYLSLEKVRFKEKMDYTIEVAPEINQETMMIPPMMIQPYVENSMRHGLRHKVNSRGRIWIRMSVAESHLIVVIEDNGIGREKAASYKTVEHIEYQSKGMSLTANRIGLINTLYGEGIGVEVLDLKDSDGRPLGTRVVMKFPLFVKATKKDSHDPNRVS